MEQEHKYKVKQEIESDLQDSDTTFVDDMQKIKKKNRKSLSFNTSDSEGLKEPKITFDESESLLKIKKKSSKLMQGDEKLQSQSLLSGVNQYHLETSSSFFTEDSEGSSPLKVKKKKHKEENELNKSIELFSQEIFKQPSSEDFNATPLSDLFKSEDIQTWDATTNERHKSKKRKNSSMFKEDEAILAKKKKKHTLETCSSDIFLTDSQGVVNSTPKKEKKNKNRNIDKSSLNSSFLSETGDGLSSLHYSINISDFNDSESEIIERKSKIKNEQINGSDKENAHKKEEGNVLVNGENEANCVNVINNSSKKKKQLNESQNGDKIDQKPRMSSPNNLDIYNNASFDISGIKKEKCKTLPLEDSPDRNTQELKREKKLNKKRKSMESQSDNLEDTLEAELDEILNGNKPSSGASDDEFDHNFTRSPKQEKRVILENLRINIDFKVPEIHKICNRASKPTLKQRQLVEAKGLTIKNGKFSKEEDKLIKANWQSFLQLYEVKDDPQMFGSLDRKYVSVQEKQKFLWFLAQNLPERTPFSVYRRFKVLFCKLKSGRFSAAEDKYIEDTLNSIGSSRVCISEMAQVLNRIPTSVEKRVMRLKNAYSRKIKWRKKNAAAFIRYLLKVTGLNQDEVKKLKDRTISSTEWDRLSRKLDGVPVRILKRAWLEKLHPILFIPHKTCDLRKIKLELVKMLYDNNERDWSTVKWNQYASHFEGLTSLRIYTMLKCLVGRRVPENKRSNLRKCLKILKDLKEDDLRKHKIQKIVYKNGEVVNFKD